MKKASGPGKSGKLRKPVVAPNKSPRLPKRMSSIQIQTVIAEIKPGDSVEIQFKYASLDAVVYLRGMHLDNLLVVANEMILYEVSRRGKWNYHSNRVFHFQVTKGWNPERFSEMLRRHLEAIRIVSPRSP